LERDEKKIFFSSQKISCLLFLGREEKRRENLGREKKGNEKSSFFPVK
jgi:hypothetical protein